MSRTLVRWPAASRKTGNSIRQAKRKSANPDDPYPAAVRVSPRITVLVDEEIDAYVDALIAARRGDADAQRRLDEMVERKRAILPRENGTPDAAPSDANGAGCCQNQGETADRHRLA